MAAVNGVSSERNYENIINSAGKDKVQSPFGDAVFSDSKDDDSLSVSDFFDLMIAQLTNQDFMNPVDDTQYLAQLAQFSSLQAMNELAQYSKTNYATSLIGKEVTIATTSEDEESGIITGVVDRVSVRNNNYYVQVNGKDYSLSQINSFGNVSEIQNEETTEENPSEISEYYAGNDEVQIWL